MNLEQLTQLANLKKIEQHPLVPIHALTPVKKFKDSTANELTKAITAYIRLTGNYAERINNTGIYDSKAGKWRKGGTRRGISDIMASKVVQHNGRSFSIMVAIEVKVGKDVMSEYQKKIQDEVIKSGGVYIIAKTWDQFYKEWELIT